jgi:hypothetical protein
MVYCTDYSVLPNIGKLQLIEVHFRAGKARLVSTLGRQAGDEEKEKKEEKRRACYSFIAHPIRLRTRTFYLLYIKPESYILRSHRKILLNHDRRGTSAFSGRRPRVLVPLLKHAVHDLRAAHFCPSLAVDEGADPGHGSARSLKGELVRTIPAGFVAVVGVFRAALRAPRAWSERVADIFSAFGVPCFFGLGCGCFSVVDSGDEEGAERGGGCHHEGDVCGHVLPVSFPD